MYYRCLIVYFAECKVIIHFYILEKGSRAALLGEQQSKKNRLNWHSFFYMCIDNGHLRTHMYWIINLFRGFVLRVVLWLQFLTRNRMSNIKRTSRSE